MNPLPNPAPSSVAGDADTHLRALRIVLIMAMLGTLLGMLGVDIYMYRQLEVVRTQLQNNRGLLERFNQNDGPVLNRLVQLLSEFATVNPDFQPILNPHLAALARIQGESPKRSLRGLPNEMPPAGGGLPAPTGIPAPRPLGE